MFFQKSLKSRGFEMQFQHCGYQIKCYFWPNFITGAQDREALYCCHLSVVSFVTLGRGLLDFVLLFSFYWTQLKNVFLMGRAWLGLFSGPMWVDHSVFLEKFKKNSTSTSLYIFWETLLQDAQFPILAKSLCPHNPRRHRTYTPLRFSNNMWVPWYAHWSVVQMGFELTTELTRRRLWDPRKTHE